MMKLASKADKKKKFSWRIKDEYTGKLYCPSSSVFNQSYEKDNGCVPVELRIDKEYGHGFIFGIQDDCGINTYVGMPQGTEGNVLVIGGNGSGKSFSIAKPTISMWSGAMCITDIKGELSKYYVELYEQGLVDRPYIVFDPLKTDGIGYDPFHWLLQNGEENLVSNVWQIVLAIIPTPTDTKDPFWVQTEQGILAADLLHFFQLEEGMSFSQAITEIMTSTVTKLTKEILESGNIKATMFLGELANMKPEQLANFDRGLRNKLMLFATDPYISNAFRGQREGASCFTWDDLEDYNIFLRIPADKVEQWSGAVNLMYTQLIRYLERRPDKYCPDGKDNIQVLLLMDEFARFGKLDMITAAMSTLSTA